MVPRHREKRIVASTCAYSLLELIIVIAALSVLVMISARGIHGVNRRCMIARCRVELDFIHSRLVSYHQTHREFPEVVGSSSDHDEGVLLRVLQLDSSVPSDVSWSQGLGCELDVSEGRILDPWKNPYVYFHRKSWSHGQYFLFSMGPDGGCDIGDASGSYDELSELNLDNVEVFR